MHPNRQCEIDGGVEWGMTYDLEGACPRCGTGALQTSAAFVNGDQLSKLTGHRAGATYHNHYLVEEGLAAELESIGATGLAFHGVYAVKPDKRQVKLRWRQLCAERTLPPMSPRTTGLTRERACEVCRRNGYFRMNEQPTRIVYRASDLRDADDVNLSWGELLVCRAGARASRKLVVFAVAARDPQGPPRLPRRRGHLVRLAPHPRRRRRWQHHAPR